ncbi:putative Uridine/cytidine kinase [Penicillium brasilianum]|uniref:Putative Uridine/cytidine kinase n=1 Tax=Penicillium brasilianum TaxID=104259 RepID=A0A1S9RS43_PENBI|nr:putative Uridine/cytidine kinase [Penicillium brasilianum]
MPEIVDDKSQHCIPFLLERLRIHTERHANADGNTPPFFLGLNGVQGAGKTVLVSTLQNTLRSEPYSLSVVTLSLDDIYLTHADQVALAEAHPTNPLLQHRGQPSTHDLALGEQVFASLAAEQPTAIPQYDKSAFAGQGDRVPQSQWEIVNSEGQKKVKVVIFEGWCVGFRAWDDQTLCTKWEDAVRQRENGGYQGRLGHVKFEDIKTVNDALKQYDVLTDKLDALIHIDAQNLRFVYEWRQEQERTLRAAKGTGMTQEQVNHFVDGYYPSYELFTENLRKGVFKPHNASAEKSDWQGRQLRLVVNRDRRVQEVIQI